MTVWLDGDACPAIVKEIVFKRAQSSNILVVLVANRPQKLATSANIRGVVVGPGLDAADHYIVEHCKAGDLVITADIPLAYEIVKKGVSAISPKGERFLESNIGDRLATRDLFSDLRAAGIVHGGPAAYGAKDRNRFAALFDRLVVELQDAVQRSDDPPSGSTPKRD